MSGEARENATMKERHTPDAESCVLRSRGAYKKINQVSVGEESQKRQPRRCRQTGRHRSTGGSRAGKVQSARAAWSSAGLDSASTDVAVVLGHSDGEEIVPKSSS